MEPWWRERRDSAPSRSLAGWALEPRELSWTVRLARGSAYSSTGTHASLHLSQLRESHALRGAHRRFHHSREELLEVRLRLPLRAARRLLPGPQRRLRDLRPGGPRDRLRQG